MNILYICADRGIPIRGHKGAAVHVRMLTNAFSRAGHTVAILTPRPGPEDGAPVTADIIEAPLPPIDNGAASNERAREWQAWTYTESLCQAASKLLEKQHFDFIYERYSLWSNVGARLSRDTGLPLALEVNAPLRQEASRFRSLFDPGTAAFVEADQFRTAQIISVVSKPLRDYVLQRGGRPEQVHVLPNAVDPARFHPDVSGERIRRQHGLDGRIVIGFSGRVRPWHDIDTLIRAFARLRAENSAYRLLLVGQTPDDLPGRLAALGLTEAATLTGPVPHSAVPQHLAAMNVAVSSHAALDNFYFSPLKLYEYLACGVPTVAANIGQPARFIQNGKTGYLYPPGDDAALAGRIRKFIENPARASKIAWQGAMTVLGQHTWDKNAQAVINWLYPDPEPIAPTEKPTVPLPILDRRLGRYLYRATRADLAKQHLAEGLPAFNEPGSESLEAVDGITIFKYKPSRRCVLGYDLHGRSAKTGQPTHRQIISKIFKDGRGERLLHLQDVLWRNGFGPEASDEIHVPRALAYLPEMRMLAQEKVPGLTLDRLLRSKTNIKPYIPRCAQGLAKLHNNRAFQQLNSDGLFPLKPYLLPDELNNLDRFTKNLAETRPEDMGDVLPLFDALRAWAGELPPLKTAVPIHRDFYYSQVLFDGMTLYLIDFDLLALGDPAIDVANFAAHLRFVGLYQLGNMDILADEAAAFKETYARYRPVDDAFWQRVAFYEAATFYRLLKVVAPRPNLARHFEALKEKTAGYFSSCSHPEKS